MSTERDSLEIHVDLCELRYKQLDDRLTRVEHKLEEMNRDLTNFKTEVRQNFNDIKSLLQSARDEKFKSIVGVAGSIIVALIGGMGYMIMHVK
jgi:chromosome segregation ATPase